MTGLEQHVILHHRVPAELATGAPRTYSPLGDSLARSHSRVHDEENVRHLFVRRVLPLSFGRGRRVLEPGDAT